MAAQRSRRESGRCLAIGARRPRDGVRLYLVPTPRLGLPLGSPTVAGGPDGSADIPTVRIAARLLAPPRASTPRGTTPLPLCGQASLGPRREAVVAAAPSPLTLPRPPLLPLPIGGPPRRRLGPITTLLPIRESRLPGAVGGRDATALIPSRDGSPT